MKETAPPAAQTAFRASWSEGALNQGTRQVPEEVPISFAYQGSAYAVLLASPGDLEDFAVGFSLTEGLITEADQITSIETAILEDGIVLRIALAEAPAQIFWDRRRYMAGPSGCGLCGIESLGEATRRPRQVASGTTITPAEIATAMAAMASRQALNSQTHGVHAAGLWLPGRGLGILREDVGRHNALDKLAGACLREGVDAARGAILLTSRVSLEMIQKTASMGAGIIVAISVPTALAIRTAEAAGITLIAVVRHDGFEVFTHPHRLKHGA